MRNPILNFNNKTDLLSALKDKMPENYQNYCTMESNTLAKNFSGKKKLKNKSKDINLGNFFSYLTEINLANYLLSKQYTFSYVDLLKTDFIVNDNLSISVKSILPIKRHTKETHESINELISSGGGKKNISHGSKTNGKIVSNQEIIVEMIDGITTCSSTEIGKPEASYLGTDRPEMSPVLSALGEFESIGLIDGYKKIMFFDSYDDEFKYCQMEDIANWYFTLPGEVLPPEAYPIFSSEMETYLELFQKGQKDNPQPKKNNIDAICFMASPFPVLVWPLNFFKDKINNIGRLQIYTKDENILNELKTFFSIT